MRVGDSLQARDTGGGSWVCEARAVSEAEPLTVTLICRQSSAAHSGEPGLQVHLLQAVPKGRKLDGIFRSATEAGVASITVFSAARSVAGIPSTDRLARLQTIITEAAEQSGAIPPKLTVAGELRSALQGLLGGGGIVSGLVLHADPGLPGPGSLHRLLADPPESGMALIVGPEGGFSPDELDEARASGMIPVYLGPPVLRTEHAALYALGALRQIARERPFWRPVSESSET